MAENLPPWSELCTCSSDVSAIGLRTGCVLQVPSATMEPEELFLTPDQTLHSTTTLPLATLRARMAAREAWDAGNMAAAAAKTATAALATNRSKAPTTPPRHSGTPGTRPPTSSKVGTSASACAPGFNAPSKSSTDTQVHVVAHADQETTPQQSNPGMIANDRPGENEEEEEDDLDELMGMICNM
eukprot:CAMPEP_0114266202 /NCGR_PEP_ID=MMETSP0058-20121206/24470_1 /TAXON_ID=36894 /ORGANISM="Pyramimonas parkeae, CCMP726" /LENGTH=184 /DNA_ID=CAMNT_0001383639 /DNA_START=197 /DNA_END=751 /DNA_ORIENTATION=+